MLSLSLSSGRVHRIGQTKPTFVHRFVIENTIEQRVYALNRKKVDPRYFIHHSVRFKERSEQRGKTMSGCD